jgi:translation elongation factor EF-G
VYNLNRGLTEKFGRLLVAFADDYREVEEVTAGNFVVLSGLKASHPQIRLRSF